MTKTDPRSLLVRGMRAVALACGLAAVLGVAQAGARPSLVIDVASGEVLQENEAFVPWYPASLTKMMTAYVAFSAMRAGRVSPGTMLKVTPYAASQKPSKMGFKPGSLVSLDAALHIIFVKSANDVSVTIAEGVSGSLSGFVNEMNQHARRLGMSGTQWRNPNGMPDPDQFTTARDMAILARALYSEFPQYAAYFRQPGIKVGGKVMRNYNALIGRFPGADGLKTGFICSSGFNLVGSAVRGGRRHVAVVFGAPSARARAERAAELLEASFSGGSSRGTLNSLQRPAGTPVVPNDLRGEVCSAKRRNVASEAEDLNAPEPMAYAPASSENQNFMLMTPPVRGSAAAAPRPSNVPRPSFLQPASPTINAVVIEVTGGGAGKGKKGKDKGPVRVRVAGGPADAPPAEPVAAAAPVVVPPLPPAPKGAASPSAPPRPVSAAVGGMAGSSLVARSNPASQQGQNRQVPVTAPALRPGLEAAGAQSSLANRAPSQPAPQAAPQPNQPMQLQPRTLQQQAQSQLNAQPQVRFTPTSAPKAKKPAKKPVKAKDAKAKPDKAKPVKKPPVKAKPKADDDE